METVAGAETEVGVASFNAGSSDQLDPPITEEKTSLKYRVHEFVISTDEKLCPSAKLTRLSSLEYSSTCKWSQKPLK